ncbi:MAG: energy-coupling factor ABC transporter permease, partial [Pirellulaceae bacterium]
MHIPDGFVSGPVNMVGAAVAGGALVVSTWRASREAREQPHLVPLLATTGAFV